MDERTSAPVVMMRIATGGMAVSILVLVGLGEYLLRSGRLAGGVAEALEGSQIETMRAVFLTLAVLFVLAALALKHAVIKRAPAWLLSAAKGLIRNAYRRPGGNGYAIMIIPPALAEAVAVLGMVLFVLTSGNRAQAYPFFLLGLLCLLAVLPSSEYEQRLIELDAEVRETMR